MDIPHEEDSDGSQFQLVLKVLATVLDAVPKEPLSLRENPADQVLSLARWLNDMFANTVVLDWPIDGRMWVGPAWMLKLQRGLKDRLQRPNTWKNWVSCPLTVHTTRAIVAPPGGIGGTRVRSQLTPWMGTGTDGFPLESPTTTRLPVTSRSSVL